MYASKLPKDGTTVHGLAIAKAVFAGVARVSDIPGTPFIYGAYPVHISTPLDGVLKGKFTGWARNPREIPHGRSGDGLSLFPVLGLASPQPEVTRADPLRRGRRFKKTIINRVFERKDEPHGTAVPHSNLSSELSTSDIENYYLRIIVDGLRRMLVPFDNIEVGVKRTGVGPSGLT